MFLVDKAQKFFKGLPDRKGHVEFITALLSVPVLLTVVLTNVINLQNKSKQNEPQPTKAQEKIIIQNVPDKTNTLQQITKTDQTGQMACKKEIGPISITYPPEGQAVSDNPVCINIKYDSSNYCSVVWSYRINGGQWSDYNSNSVCLYNVPKGDVKFELRVQSTVSQDQTNIMRNFKYEGETISPTPSNTATSSSELR